MITLIYSGEKARLDAFRNGVEFAYADLGDLANMAEPKFSQGEDGSGYYLIIEDDVPEDNVTYSLGDCGLLYRTSGVEI